jgi:hypothetical protein
MPGTAPAASSTRRVARRAWSGLIQVLAGPDAAPAWRWRSPSQRRAAYAVLGMATVALGALNVASMHGQPIVTPAPPTACRASPCHSVNYLPPSIGQWLLAVAVVTPLLLAARYPLLG